VAEQTGATKVAVAHHADDQVETILFRLLRGTGLHGLTGIPPRRWLVPGKIEVVRPLLSVFRSDLERYCAEAGITPREDSSNRSRKYMRNRLRLDVLPLLAQINPRYREHILELAEAVKIDDRYLMEIAKFQEKQVLIERSLNKVVISRKKFQNCDLALQRRLITLILNYLSSGIEWSSQHVKAVLHVIESDNPSAAIQLPKQLTVERRYDQVRFLLDQPMEEAGSFSYQLKIPGTVHVAESGIAVHASLRQTAPDLTRLSENEVVFDADRLPGKLMVRNRQPGDRIVLFGSRATKKLKELLIDAKVPKAFRDRIPVVTAGNEIVWVPGLRRSASAVVNENTTRFLHLKVEYGEDWQEVFP
jgi:tRNA(Ile)-lysidine synthase